MSRHRLEHVYQRMPHISLEPTCWSRLTEYEGFRDTLPRGWPTPYSPTQCGTNEARHRVYDLVRPNVGLECNRSRALGEPQQPRRCSGAREPGQQLPNRSSVEHPPPKYTDTHPDTHRPVYKKGGAVRVGFGQNCRTHPDPSPSNKQFRERHFPGASSVAHAHDSQQHACPPTPNRKHVYSVRSLWTPPPLASC